MPVSFDVEKLARWISARWERPSTIIILLLAIFFAGLFKFTGTELSDLSLHELLGILSFCALVFLLWKRSVAFPRAPKQHVGFAVAISCETEELEKTLVADFVGSLQRLLSQHSLTHKFRLVRIPKRHASGIVDADDAIRARARARCHFMIWGTARLRTVGGKERHVLNLEFLVAHRAIPRQLSQQFAKEMAELFPRRLHIDRENDLLSLEFTSEWIDCVTQYTIGIAASFSGDLVYAESLFLSVWANKHLQKSPLPPFKKMRQRVPIRLGEIYAYHASKVYEKWRETREPQLMEEMWAHLTKVRNFYPDNYSGRLLAAIYFFAAKRDVEAAIREIIKARTAADGTWRFSYAFLLGYKGDLLKAMRMYRIAAQQHCDRPDVVMQCEEFMMWVMEQEPEHAQLHFCLGLLNWLVKGDKALALQHFQSFVDQCTAEAFPEPIRLAGTYCNTLSGEISKARSEQEH